MNTFNDELHIMTKSADGSYTAYSKEYNEHYHSTKDGALNESLFKHVEPAFKLKKMLKEVNILDICFGLGFNTLATIYYCKKNALNLKLNIFSPELDTSLRKALTDFTYPKEFKVFKHIILELANKGFYYDADLYIEVFSGDAREYIRKFKPEFFDIVYQDAFSPSSNPLLWTKEYFSDITNIIKKDAVLTTYSTALATRIALYENGFNLYINKGENFRDATVASLRELHDFIAVDMKHKISCNPHVKPLRD
ncbi:hypothetical protein CVO_00665 [Sulfurimonas sp. CVO]|uniref:tRNA (5-methylaminomethyl-2-thiouridine)(34)-methyltransferase MnmD n=1 Tax=Sulfurimonas sp. CVO TaxID=2283483 RepID=UPI00132F2AF7|nr:MnmC family methyltransferase [Sulfurimonas sp. CVO]QHG90433.1 hypothetical protein CVO_00665 [Sulfurimonas sp. CVO]